MTLIANLLGVALLIATGLTGIALVALISAHRIPEPEDLNQGEKNS